MMLPTKLQQSEQRQPLPCDLYSRRQILSGLGNGLGGLALASLLPSKLLADGPRADNLLPRAPHFPAKARSVIQLFMHGGPSHLDLLDPKPVLDRLDGQPPPREVEDDERITGNLLKSPFRFRKYGQSGLEFSEVLPHIAQHADRIAVIRSMHTEHRNHEQSLWKMHTGLDCLGPAQHWRLGDLWIGDRKPEFTRLRGVARPARLTGRWHQQLVERLDAAAVSGNAIPLRRNAGT